MSSKGKISKTPLVEGEQATFVWHGSQAPELIGDFNEWDAEHPLRLKRETPGVWSRRMQLPPDTYMEYAYLLNGERISDPHNPDTVYNGMDASNHFFYMPQGRPVDLAQRQRGVPRGKLVRQVVEGGYTVVGGRRRVIFYQPPVSEPCPLLVVMDGTDYKDRASLVEIVDNLIDQKRIQPVALAMIANGKQARSVEYACNDATLEFLRDGVLPAAMENLNLIDIRQNPGAFGILGASMGGLIALYTGLRLPHLFGRVLSQCGAFDPDYVIYDLVRWGDPKPVEVWMDIGIYDSLLPMNQQMHALLAARGYQVTYREYHGGHNYSSWRDDVWRGLEALFAGPQAGKGAAE